MSTKRISKSSDSKNPPLEGREAVIKDDKKIIGTHEEFKNYRNPRTLLWRAGRPASKSIFPYPVFIAFFCFLS
jgi:hypothetical protein